MFIILSHHHSACDKEGRNILFYCIHGTKRHESCMDLAIQRGADIHVMDNNGKLILHEACKQGLDVIVDLLLEAGVDADRIENSKDDSLVRLHIEIFDEICRI